MSNNIGDLIREYRAKRKMSSSQLAEKVGVSQATISNIERGKKKYSQTIVDKIVEALDIPVKDINSEDTTEAEFLSYKNVDSRKYKFGFSNVEITVQVTPNVTPVEGDIQSLTQYTIHANSSPVIVDKILGCIDENIEDISKEVSEEAWKRMTNTTEKP